MATRTISNAGGNFNSTSTWVEAAVPSSADTVFATSTSGPLTVNVASSAGSLMLTAYTNTLTMSNTLSVYGNITLGSGMTSTGTGTLSIVTGATLTSNNKPWNTPINFALISNGTVTLADNWTGNTTVSNAIGSGVKAAVNGNIFYCKSHLNVGSQLISGSTKFIMAGTGTLSGGSSGGYIQNDIDINTSGTITFGPTLCYNSGTLTYISGNTITTGCQLDLRDGSTTKLQISGITWNGNIINTNTATVQLLSNLYCSGSIINTINPLVINATGSSLYIGSGITSNSGISGTAPLILTGSGIWQGAGAIRNNLNINTSGTIQVAGSVAYNTGTLSYSAGTVSTAGSSILTQASTIWNCSGITWNTFSVQGGTQTLINNLIINGTFNSSNPIVYNGADLIINSSMNVFQRIDGTSTLRYKGTGTWSQQGPVNLNMVIDTPGTLTLNGIVAAANLTYLNGTVVTTNSTLINGGNLGTYNYSTSGIIFNNVAFTLGIINLNETFNASGNLTVGASTTTTFDGSYGFNVGTFRCLVPGRSVVLKSGNTYNCDNLQLIGTNAARILLRSNTSNAYTYFNLNTGGTCDVKWCNPTDIDSSGGRLITDVKGTLTRTINWYRTNPDYFNFF